MYDPWFNAGPPQQAFGPESVLLLRSLQHPISYGFDPHFDPPSDWADFDPRYIALLYVRLESDWSIAVNHACYRMPAGNSIQDRLDKALAVMQDRIDLWKGTGTPPQPPADVRFGDEPLRGRHSPFMHQLPYHPDPTRACDSESFEDFRFASQNELFIFIHHPTLDVGVTPGNLIGLTPKATATTVKMPNGAFFKAQAVGLGALDTELKCIRVRNYFTDGAGQPFPTQQLSPPYPAERPDRSLEYAMDIKFQVNAGPAGWVTMVIDPDTGNGTGNEP